MKKGLVALLIAIAIILIALILFLPLTFGKMVQNRLMSLPSSDEFRFEVVNYHRGWFSSDATIKVSLKNPNTVQLSQFGLKGNGIIQFTSREHIIHGPLMFAQTDTGRRLMAGQAYAIGEVNHDGININNYTWIKLNGDIDSKIIAPQVNYANPALKTVSSIKNLDVHVKMTKDMTKVFGNINIGEVSFANTEAKQDFLNTAATYDITKTPEGVFTGRRDIQLGSFIYTNLSNNQSVIAKNLHIASQSFEASNRINLAIQAALDSIVVGNKQYGPHNFVLNINNMDAQALNGLTKESYSGANKNDLAAQIARSLQIARYNQLLMSLFSKGMQIDLKKLNLVTEWGNAAATANIVFEQQARDTLNPFTLLQKAQANVNLQLPQELVLQVMTRHYEGNPSVSNPAQQAQAQINEWINNRWLIPIDRSYKVNFIYKNNAATINGASFPKQQESSPVVTPAQ